MMYATLMLVAELICIAIIVVLIIRVVKKYINAKPVRDEKKQSAETLGEVLRIYRTENKMTQEFVAESLGVSRQAVSKWESGASDPSTTNLIALARDIRYYRNAVRFGMDDLKDVNELANKYPEARPLINRKKKTDKEKE